MAGILFFSSCAVAPVSQPVSLPEAAPEPEAGTLQAHFCRAAEEETSKIGAQLEHVTPETKVDVELGSCAVFVESLGKATFIIHAYIGGRLAYDMEVVRIMNYQNGNWIMVNQGPIYLIDYMNGRIVWFIERQVGEPSSGSEI